MLYLFTITLMGFCFASIPYICGVDDAASMVVESKDKKSAREPLDHASKIEKKLCKEAKKSDNTHPVLIAPQEDKIDLRKAKRPIEFYVGDMKGKAQFKWKPETFFARNSNLLNNTNRSDMLYRNQGTLDTNIGLAYGHESFGHDAVEFFVTIRNKHIWGNPEGVVQTTATRIKDLDWVGLEHRHFFTRLVTWLREVWLKFCINDALDLVHLKRKHFFTIGAFPFELGRAISLGSAFGVNPVALGFFSDNTIDQFAFGAKFSGELADKLTYDLYGEIVENASASFSQTTLKILGQKYEQGRDMPERGSGKVNYIIASRLRWAHEEKGDTLHAKTTALFEPYLLYNDVPEQAVEFPADAESKLGTFGLAAEFISGDFEWGFDTAVNVGRQMVHGWDRNEVGQENRDGFDTRINTRVVTANPNVNSRAPKALFDPNNPTGRKAQEIIDHAPQQQSQNGAFIGEVTAPDGTVITLFNDLNRFRDPRRNSFKGWMFVMDGGYWIYKREVKITGLLAVASGDENPNVDLEDPINGRQDNTFSGFIGLQEIYSGSRVQSAFFLGGAGRVPRPLSTPRSRIVLSRLPSRESGFTNLIWTGTALHWYPKWRRAFALRANAMLFFQQHATNRFDLQTNMGLSDDANRLLGAELNTFVDKELLPDFKLYLVGSIFIPGPHFRDIRGTPLNREQQRFIDRLDVTGIETPGPLLNNDVAYTLNIGLEMRY